MLSIGIIWGTVFDYFPEITDCISSKTKLIEFYDEEVLDKVGFIYAVYQDMLPDKEKLIKLKLDNVFIDNNIIRIVIFDFDETKTVFHPYKEKMVYKELDDLKQHIRQFYGSLIDHYVFDNVFHCTDNAFEFDYLFGLLKSYYDEIRLNTKIKE